METDIVFRIRRREEIIQNQLSVENIAANFLHLCFFCSVRCISSRNGVQQSRAVSNAASAPENYPTPASSALPASTVNAAPPPLVEFSGSAPVVSYAAPASVQYAPKLQHAAPVSTTTVTKAWMAFQMKARNLRLGLLRRCNLGCHSMFVIAWVRFAGLSIRGKSAMSSSTPLIFTQRGLHVVSDQAVSAVSASPWNLYRDMACLWVSPCGCF